MYKKLSLSIITLAIVFFIGIYNQMFSQTASSPTKKELIKELVGIMNIRETATKDMEQRLTQLVEAMKNQVLNDSKSTQGQKEIVNEQLDKFAHMMKVLPEKLNQRINFGKFSEDVAIEVYDKYYTDNEIKDFIVFYKSPTGQKSLQTMSLIKQEMAGIVYKKTIPIITEIVSEEMEKQKKSN